MDDKQPQSKDLYFDPANHPDDTLKAFDDFTQTFELRYAAQYPDPPKVSLDAAVRRWTVANTTDAVADPKPNLAQYDDIVSTWQSKDKVKKFLGMFSSNRFYTDWLAAEQDEALRNAATWDDLVTKMKAFYKPTENLTLKHFQFRTLAQEPNEAFPAFCNRVGRTQNTVGLNAHMMTALPSQQPLETK